MRIGSILTALLRDQRGATAIEYGLILALIFLAMVGALQAFGGGADGLWAKVSSRVTEAMTG